MIDTSFPLRYYLSSKQEPAFTSVCVCCAQALKQKCGTNYILSDALQRGGPALWEINIGVSTAPGLNYCFFSNASAATLLVNVQRGDGGARSPEVLDTLHRPSEKLGCFSEEAATITGRRKIFFACACCLLFDFLSELPVNVCWREWNPEKDTTRRLKSHIYSSWIDGFFWKDSWRVLSSVGVVLHKDLEASSSSRPAEGRSSLTPLTTRRP